MEWQTKLLLINFILIVSANWLIGMAGLKPNKGKILCFMGPWSLLTILSVPAWVVWFIVTY